MTHRTARVRAIRHQHCRSFPRASQPARRLMTGMRNMVLKGFSYAMIGAFAGGIAMTIAGSASVLMGL